AIRVLGGQAVATYYPGLPVRRSCGSRVRCIALEAHSSDSAQRPEPEPPERAGPEPTGAFAAAPPAGPLDSSAGGALRLWSATRAEWALDSLDESGSPPARHWRVRARKLERRSQEL